MTKELEVGDRVYDAEWRPDVVGVITEKKGDKSYMVDYSPHPYGICTGMINTKTSHLIKIVESKPLITETLVRTLNPGEYGNLTIYKLPLSNDLRIEFNTSKHTAEELKESAHILNQIAEYLEESK